MIKDKAYYDSLTELIINFGEEKVKIRRVANGI